MADAMDIPSSASLPPCRSPADTASDIGYFRIPAWSGKSAPLEATTWNVVSRTSDVVRDFGDVLFGLFASAPELGGCCNDNRGNSCHFSLCLSLCLSFALPFDVSCCLSLSSALSPFSHTDAHTHTHTRKLYLSLSPLSFLFSLSLAFFLSFSCLPSSRSLCLYLALSLCLSLPAFACLHACQAGQSVQRSDASEIDVMKARFMFRVC